MRRDPVENDADARLVEGVHERHEVFGRAEAGSDGIVARDLIAPRTVKRVFAYGHEFNVRIAHFLDVLHKFGCKVAIRIIIAVVMNLPGKKIDFVYVHGRTIYIFFLEIFKILSVLPDIPIQIVQLGARGGRRFRMKCVRIGFQQFPTVLCGNAIFINVVFF